MKILRNSFCRAQRTTWGYGVYHYYMHQHNYYDCYYFFRYTHYFVFLLPFQMMGKDEEITYPWITIRICSRFIMKKMFMIWTEKAFLCVQFAFSHWKKLMFSSKSLISDFHNISYWTQLILLLICVWAIFFTLQYRQKCLCKRQAYVFGFHCLIEIVGLVYRQPFTTIIQHYNDPS